ncbi:MAP kinase-activating death domain protein [Diplonema papillatum]|nr:MAP kinase-activating death domain protein [Diplonema papillatum]
MQQGQQSSLVEAFLVVGGDSDDGWRLHKDRPKDGLRAARSDRERLSHCVFEPVVQQRYPDPWHGQPLLVEMFCLPGGVTVSNDPSRTLSWDVVADQPDVFFFTLTSRDGALLHGATLQYYEPLSRTSQQNLWAVLSPHCPEPDPATEVHRAAAKLFTEKSLCLLSKHAQFSTMKQLLLHLYRLLGEPTSSVHDVFDFVRWMVDDIRLPVAGTANLRIPVGCRHLQVDRPPLGCLPVIDCPLHFLFENSGARVVVTLFHLALLEKKIVVLSKHRNVLTAAVHAVHSFLQPLRWLHVRVPLLPDASRFRNILSAPVPYLVGVCTKKQQQARGQTPAEALSAEFPEVAVIDLDERSVLIPGAAGYLPGLPPAAEKELVDRLSKLLSPYALDPEHRPRHRDYDAAIFDASNPREMQQTQQQQPPAPHAWSSPTSTAARRPPAAAAPPRLPHSLSSSELLLPAAHPSFPQRQIQAAFYLFLLRVVSPMEPHVHPGRDDDYYFDEATFLSDPLPAVQHSRPFYREFATTQIFSTYTNRKTKGGAVRAEVAAFVEHLARAPGAKNPSWKVVQNAFGAVTSFLRSSSSQQQQQQQQQQPQTPQGKQPQQQQQQQQPHQASAFDGATPAPSASSWEDALLAVPLRTMVCPSSAEAAAQRRKGGAAEEAAAAAAFPSPGSAAAKWERFPILDPQRGAARRSAAAKDEKEGICGEPAADPWAQVLSALHTLHRQHALSPPPPAAQQQKQKNQNQQLQQQQRVLCSGGVVGSRVPLAVSKRPSSSATSGTPKTPCSAGNRSGAGAGGLVQRVSSRFRAASKVAPPPLCPDADDSDSPSEVRTPAAAAAAARGSSFGTAESGRTLPAELAAYSTAGCLRNASVLSSVAKSPTATLNLTLNGSTWSPVDSPVQDPGHLHARYPVSGVVSPISESLCLATPAKQSWLRVFASMPASENDSAGGASSGGKACCELSLSKADDPQTSWGMTLTPRGDDVANPTCSGSPSDSDGNSSSRDTVPPSLQPGFTMDAAGSMNIVSASGSVAHINLSTVVDCASCCVLLSEEYISHKLSAALNDYRAECPNCSKMFVPHFSVLTKLQLAASECPAGTDAATCRAKQVQYLSVPHLMKEVNNLIAQGVVVDGRLLTSHTTTFWNLLRVFRHMNIPMDLLLPQVNWGDIVSGLAAAG